MPRLNIVDVWNGDAELGWIEMYDDTVRFSDEMAESLFRQYKNAGEWSDRQTFDALATGWSNGYIQIPALTD